VPTTERKPGADLEALKAVRNKHGAHSDEYKAVLQEISAMRNMEKKAKEAKELYEPRGSEEDIGVYTDIKCGKNHGLVRFTADDDDYGCDVCQSTIEMGTYVYGCDKCDWDMCSKCEEKKQKEYDIKYGAHTDMKCDKGHNIIRFETRSAHSACSICNANIPHATYLLNCWKCNWNMCLNCEETRHQKINKEIDVKNQKIADGIKVRGSKDDVGVHTDMKCLKNHGLIRHMVHDDNTTCHVCKSKIAAGTFIVGCDKCNWDMCFKCEEKKQKETNDPGEHTTLLDDKGHKLVKYIARIHNQCDVCNEHVINGTKMFGCDECMSDICSGCEQKKVASQKIEEKRKKTQMF